jgi:hypothetical protein
MPAHPDTAADGLWDSLKNGAPPITHLKRPVPPKRPADTPATLNFDTHCPRRRILLMGQECKGQHH